MLALADWADDAGMCYPTQKMIAAKTRQSKRNVIRVLEKLRDRGWIGWEKGVGRGNSNTYQIRFSNLGKGDTSSHYLDGEKGDTVTSPIKADETVTSESPISEEKVTNPAVKGDTSPHTRGKPSDKPSGTHSLRAREEDPVDAYKRITGESCQAYWQSLIRGTVGEMPEARMHWAALCEVWRDTERWNSKMVPNLLDAFKQQREKLGYEAHRSGPGGRNPVQEIGGNETRAGGEVPRSLSSGERQRIERKRDGELSNFEYLIRSGFSEQEARELAGYGNAGAEELSGTPRGRIARLHSGNPSDRSGNGSHRGEGKITTDSGGAGESELDVGRTGTG